MVVILLATKIARPNSLFNAYGWVLSSIDEVRERDAKTLALIRALK